MRILKRAIPIAILLSIWAIASRLYASPLLPGPDHVTRALASSVRDGSLSWALATTLGRLAIGYVLALVFGVVFGFLCAKVAWQHTATRRTRQIFFILSRLTTWTSVIE